MDKPITFESIGDERKRLDEHEKWIETFRKSETAEASDPCEWNDTKAHLVAPRRREYDGYEEHYSTRRSLPEAASSVDGNLRKLTSEQEEYLQSEVDKARETGVATSTSLAMEFLKSYAPKADGGFRDTSAVFETRPQTSQDKPIKSCLKDLASLKFTQLQKKTVSFGWIDVEIYFITEEEKEFKMIEFRNDFVEWNGRKLRDMSSSDYGMEELDNLDLFLARKLKYKTVENPAKVKPGDKDHEREMPTKDVRKDNLAATKPCKPVLTCDIIDRKFKEDMYGTMPNQGINPSKEDMYGTMPNHINLSKEDMYGTMLNHINPSKEDMYRIMPNHTNPSKEDMYGTMPNHINPSKKDMYGTMPNHTNPSKEDMYGTMPNHINPSKKDMYGTMPNHINPSKKDMYGTMPNHINPSKKDMYGTMPNQDINPSKEVGLPALKKGNSVKSEQESEYEYDTPGNSSMVHGTKAYQPSVKVIAAQHASPSLTDNETIKLRKTTQSADTATERMRRQLRIANKATSVSSKSDNSLNVCGTKTSPQLAWGRVPQNSDDSVSRCYSSEANLQPKFREFAKDHSIDSLNNENSAHCKESQCSPKYCGFPNQQVMRKPRESRKYPRNASIVADVNRTESSGARTITVRPKATDEDDDWDMVEQVGRDMDNSGTWTAGKDKLGAQTKTESKRKLICERQANNRVSTESNPQLPQIRFIMVKSADGREDESEGCPRMNSSHDLSLCQNEDSWGEVKASAGLSEETLPSMSTSSGEDNFVRFKPMMDLERPKTSRGRRIPEEDTGERQDSPTPGYSAIATPSSCMSCAESSGYAHSPVSRPGSLLVRTPRKPSISSSFRSVARRVRKGLSNFGHRLRATLSCMDNHQALS